MGLEIYFISRGVPVESIVVNVAVVPNLHQCNVLSLKAVAQKGYEHSGDPRGISMAGGGVLFSPRGSVNSMMGDWMLFMESFKCLVSSRPHAIVPSGINTRYFTVGYSRKDVLRKPVDTLGVKLEDKLQQCEGCSAPSIRQRNTTQASKKVQRMFVDLAGPEQSNRMEEANVLQSCQMMAPVLNGCSF